MILTTIFAFAVTTVATTGADNASVTALSASPIPTSSESKCQIAGSAIQAVAATRPIPLSNFTAYMDAHDPFVRGCVTPFDVAFNSSTFMESAYLEEAAWYNAAYPTISQLVRECERDEPVLGEKTWRQVGLREGLPRTWKDVIARFPACPPPIAPGKETDTTGKDGHSHKGQGDEVVYQNGAGPMLSRASTISARFEVTLIILGLVAGRWI